jgi:hypothetical protein
MTKKEALQAVLTGISVMDATLEKALLDNELTGADTYTKDDVKTIDLCAIDVLQAVLSMQNVSEGGYSISTNVEAVKARLLYLANKHNISEVLDQYKPTLRGVSRW